MELVWHFSIAWLLTSAHVSAALYPEAAHIKRSGGIFTAFNCDPNNKSVKFAVSPPKPVRPGDIVNVTLQFTPRFDVWSVSYEIDVLVNHSIIDKRTGAGCAIEDIYFCGLQANKTVIFTKNDLVLPLTVPFAHVVVKGLAYNQDDELFFCAEIHYDENGPVGFTKD